jgi:hypothetical protein
VVLKGLKTSRHPIPVENLAAAAERGFALLTDIVEALVTLVVQGKIAAQMAQSQISSSVIESA